MAISGGDFGHAVAGFDREQQSRRMPEFCRRLIAAQARKVDALKTHKGTDAAALPREGETQPASVSPNSKALAVEGRTLGAVCELYQPGQRFRPPNWV